MKREIELKYAINDEQQFVSILTSLGVQLSNPIVQDDTIYFRKGKGFSDLHKGEPVIRIRQTAKTITTTLKVYKNGVSDRAEVECGITDQTAFDEYLKCLGFNVIVHVKKQRRQAEFQGAQIVLDQVDKLGAFVEIEIVTDDSNVNNARNILDSLANKLGLDINDIVNIPYGKHRGVSP